MEHANCGTVNEIVTHAVAGGEEGSALGIVGRPMWATRRAKLAHIKTQASHLTRDLLSHVNDQSKTTGGQEGAILRVHEAWS